MEARVPLVNQEKKRPRPKVWLRGADLNHRPLGYEFKGKLIRKNLQAHG